MLCSNFKKYKKRCYYIADGGKCSLSNTKCAYLDTTLPMQVTVKVRKTAYITLQEYLIIYSMYVLGVSNKNLIARQLGIPSSTMYKRFDEIHKKLSDVLTVKGAQRVFKNKQAVVSVLSLMLKSTKDDLFCLGEDDMEALSYVSTVGGVNEVQDYFNSRQEDATTEERIQDGGLTFYDRHPYEKE